jgi:4-hydroxy-tetrahydrodipicolinate synthase
VLLLPPFYYKGVSDEGIFRFVAEVIERTGDQRLRIYLYHIPPVAQVGFSLSLIERLLKAYPQAIVGIKDSSGDWKNQEAMLKAFPGFGIFSGSEKFLLDNLRLGGAGGINAIANAVPGQLRKVYEAWQSPQAEVLQEGVMIIAKARGNAPAIPVLKAITAHYRQEPAWQTVRPPFTPLSESEARRLLSNLHEYSFQYDVTPGAQ